MPSSLERRVITGKAVPIEGNEIDTDRIIPARYLKETTFDRMGEYLFYDARFKEDGSEQEGHPLNNPKFNAAKIMVVQNNFGCGSSREHAPQAIMRYGIKALVGESFAEIFAGNCKALGIPTVTATKEKIDYLFNALNAESETELTINLDQCKIELRNIHTNKVDVISVAIPEERRKSFIEGTWDELAILKNNLPQIHERANQLPYFNNFQ